MRRFAITNATVNNVFALVRGCGVVVSAKLQGVLHLLTDTLHTSWSTPAALEQRYPMPQHEELKRFNMLRSIVGLPKLVPAMSSASNHCDSDLRQDR